MAGAAAADGRFTACGISLVAHMANPYVPAVHLNLRYLSHQPCLVRRRLGSDADLSVRGGHRRRFTRRCALPATATAPTAYTEYKAWCDRYFYLPHRQEPRGVGGIFFDDLASGDREADFAFVRAVGEAVLEVYPRIVARRKDTPYDEAARERLLLKRGRYVEFNLVYDRGHASSASAPMRIRMPT